MEIRELLLDELTKIWDKDRADKFLVLNDENIDDDQFEALSKLIGFIEGEVEDLTEEALTEISKRVDTFDTPKGFIEYFFTQTDKDSLPSVMEAIEEDPEEIEAILNSMQESGILEYYADFDGFYVWYKG